MDPGLHVKQGVNLINRIIGYYPFVREGGRATVALTREDWHVLADVLFHMNTPKEFIPDQVEDYRLSEDRRTIELDVPDCKVLIEMSG